MTQLKQRGFVFFIAVIASFMFVPGVFGGSVNAEGTADVEGLITSLAETDDPCGVAELLAKTGDLRALPPLVELIQRNKNKKVQACAAQALAALDAKKATALLIAELNNPDVHAASRSALALGIIKDDAAVEPLLKALFESNFSNSAAIALGMIKAPRSLEPLIGALKNQSAGIRGHAIWALGDFGDRRACEGLVDVFMSEWSQGGDLANQIWAIEVIEELQCSFNASYTKKYKLSNTCCNKAQQVVKVLVPLIDKNQDPREWGWETLLKNNADLANICGPIFNEAFGGPEAHNQFFVVFSILEWGKAAVSFRYMPDDEVAAGRLGKEKELERIETGLRLVCPKIKLPDYIRNK